MTLSETKYDISGLRGHNLQRDYLLKSISKQRTASSYLFYGPEGIGKKLVAVEFASKLNCMHTADDKKITTDCGCRSCQKIFRGIHPDIMVTQSEGLKEIKVDQVREQIEEQLYLKPYEGRYKVALVDNADLMNINAQNAFLKTLEEPPGDSVIILITCRPQYLLPTIVSRCQRVEYFSLPDELIKEFLARDEFTEEELDQAVKISRGRPAKALLIDRDFIEQRKIIIQNLLELNIQNAVKISGFTDEFVKDKKTAGYDRINFLFEIILLFLKDVILLKNGMDKDYLINGDLYNDIERTASEWSFEKLFSTVKFAEQAWLAVLHTNINWQYVVENLALEFAEEIEH